MDSCSKLSVRVLVEAWRTLLDVLADSIGQDKKREVCIAVSIWISECFDEVREVGGEYGIC